MSWNGSIKPSRDSQSVIVMALLSVAPAREMCFAPLAAIVMLSVATNFDGVLSAFIINSPGLLYWKSIYIIDILMI